MSAVRRHSYTCPGCGVTVHTDAGWRARIGQPCIACARQKSGWTHAEDCPSMDDMHPGLCSEVGAVMRHAGGSDA